MSDNAQTPKLPTQADRAAFLAQCDLFAVLPDHVLASLAAVARVRVFKRNQDLFARGDPGNALFLVLSGMVRISISSPEGRELTLSLASPGQAFGELALLDGGPRTAGATVVVPSVVLVLDRKDFLAVAEARPELAMRIIEVLCRRLRDATRQIEELSFASVPIRLARMLRRLAVAQGQPFADGVAVRTTQKELGDAIGLSREAVNRMLRVWSADGLIAVETGRIEVLRADRIDGMAQLGGSA